MRAWYRDLTDAWYYLRRTIRVARGIKIIPDRPPTIHP
jgi:hypothetical protein